MSDYIKMYENPSYKGERKDAERLAEQLKNFATYEQGIARWKSNNRCIPNDCAEFAVYLGLPIDLMATQKQRAQEDEEFLAVYFARNKNREYTEEEKSEMDAAFGPGETVVNVITGKEYKTK